MPLVVACASSVLTPVAESADQERARAVAMVAAHGWRVARVTKRGYLIMRCACGEHQETLHKTPSQPGHFRRKADRMVSLCSTQVP